MAISTYSELKTAIATWAKRSDLTALLPDFVRLAELRIGRDFAPRGIELEVELVTVAASRYVALPDGMSNPLGLWLKAYTPRVAVIQRLPAELEVSTVAGYPDYWAVDGANIAFDKPASAAWAIDFRYVAPFALSDAAPTNYVLTNHPDIYLFAALIEAAWYAEDRESAGLYQQRYQAAVQAAQSVENDAKAGVALFTEFGQAAGRSDIYRGY